MKLSSIFLVGLFFLTEPIFSMDDKIEDSRWSSSSPLTLTKLSGPADATQRTEEETKGASDLTTVSQQIKSLCCELESAKKEIQFLREALAWTINPFFPEISDPSILAFRSRLQAQLSTLFGRQKLGIEEKETSYLLFFTNSASKITDYIPNSEVQAALRILIKSVEISSDLYDLFKKDKPSPYIFSSFAEIDRVSYLVSAGIASIYSPQIEQLDESQAIILAECAYSSLSSLVKRSKRKGTAGILPEQLILALGTYHLGILKKAFSLPGNPHRRATVIAHIGQNNWYDMDLFLGSGIRVGEENYIVEAKYYFYYNPHNIQGLIYTSVPDKSDIYGYRNGTDSYLKYLKNSDTIILSPEEQLGKIKSGEIRDLKGTNTLSPGDGIEEIVDA